LSNAAADEDPSGDASAMADCDGGGPGCDAGSSQADAVADSGNSDGDGSDGFEAVVAITLWKIADDHAGAVL